MMNPPTLHGGTLGTLLLLMHGLWKLYKKFILAWNEWAWINGLLKVFVSQCSLAYWGSLERAGSDHMSSFHAFVWVYLCGNCISCGHCVHRLTSPYIHCQAIAGPATETNWYIQAPAPFGSHDTFQTNKKRTFWPVENLEERLVAMETRRPALHGPLNSNQM